MEHKMPANPPGHSASQKFYCGTVVRSHIFRQNNNHFQIPQKHVEPWRYARALFCSTNFTLAPETRWFFAENVIFLTGVYRLIQHNTFSHATNATSRIRVHTSFTERQFFSKLCDVFRTFISGFVCLAAHENMSLEKNQRSFSDPL